MQGLCPTDLSNWIWYHASPIIWNNNQQQARLQPIHILCNYVKRATNYPINNSLRKSFLCKNDSVTFGARFPGKFGWSGTVDINNKEKCFHIFYFRCPTILCCCCRPSLWSYGRNPETVTTVSNDNNTRGQQFIVSIRNATEILLIQLSLWIVEFWVPLFCFPSETFGIFFGES